MNVSTILENGRTLLANGFTQKAFARDADGNRVDLYNEKATCFCVSGAIQRVVFNEDTEKTLQADTWYKVWETVNKALPEGWDNVIQFNDKNSQEEVLALLDRAIAMAKEQEEQNEKA